MKKVLYLVPFILSVMFYTFIIIADASIENLVIIDVLLLLALLLISGLGTMSDKKLFNVIGIVALFTVSFALIKMGIENDYLVLTETKIAIAILLYYLIIFIVTKNKRLIIMNAVIIVILAILFVPNKKYVNDGGTIEYNAIAYKYIKWNTTRNDGTPLKEDDLYWFSNNFHSLEYYKPVESPVVNVSVDNQEILCSKGSFHWSKTVDGQQMFVIADAFTNPVRWDYKNSLVIANNTMVKVDTPYTISKVKYTEYKEKYTESNIETVNHTFNDLNYNNENKTIDLTNLENNTYIVSFSIINDKDYADYAFKVRIEK